ncbi:MAG: UDP-N-acetylmuramate dehydrogenase [Polyangiaceae bacterium]|nr:UDP-N-acetylmuramate dehydrogenase [Polyangiaceae bacterium]
MELERDVPLAPKTTLGVGGNAECFATAKTEAEVGHALGWAREHGHRVHVLGGGSNVVVSDDGVPGLVLSIALRGIDWGDAGRVSVAAGEPWDGFVREAVARGLAGLECLSGVPGLTGATPIQNVGAYGQEVSETIERVVAMDRRTGERVELSHAECGFAYRDSFFKRDAPDRFVVLAVVFQLIPGGAPKLTYPELERAAPRSPSVADVRRTVLELRAKKSMLFDPADENGRSCGSFFVNPIVSPEQAAQLPPDLPCYPQPDGRVKLSAAWLIERSGLVKGTREGNVGLSTKHTLCIVAHHGARATEVLRFAARVKRTVRDRFGVELEPEPMLWGFAAGLPVAG